MRTESAVYIAIWTITGLAGAVFAFMGRRQAAADKAALAATSDDDPLKAYLAASAVRTWTGRIAAQAIVLLVSALSVTMMAVDAHSVAGVALRTAWVWALELISAQLLAMSAVDLWAHHKAGEIADGHD